jgi:hypothetical protein
MANFMPKPHYLLALQNQALPWWKCLGELIDNSFDHGADRVEIREAHKPKSITVEDNGRGIKCLVSALSIGDSKPTGESRLGRYGIGLKDAWLSTGDKICISSTHEGVTSMIELDVSDFGDDWSGPDPTSSVSQARSGTRILLCLRKSRKLPSHDVYDKLSWVFSPGLLQGKQIVKVTSNGQRTPLTPRCLPDLTEAIQDTFQVRGKEVRINIGLVKPGTKLFDGPFCFAHMHRIIESSSLGSKGMSCQNIAGLVTLGDGWELSKNKDAITDCEDELESEIYDRIKHLLIKAEQLSHDLESSQLRQELETLLNAAIGEHKREARESKRESSGTVDPVHTGKKRTKAKDIHEQLPGSVITNSGQRVRGVRLDWEYRQDELIGSYDHRTNTVRLNASHNYVKAAKEQANTQALIPMAVAVLSDWLCTHKDQEKTMFPVEEFAATYSVIMKSMRYS